ncbi:GNAT family N-acetyltransferase [Shewanella salipaludis]|nr:GNAT family N-acetyltransferase [Shewanella salipaludis]
MTLQFIPASEADRAYLLALRKSTMVTHLEKSGQFLSDAEHMFRLNEGYSHSHLIIFNHARVGTLKYRETDTYLEIMQLQIEPGLQGRGLGTRVIKHLLAAAQGKAVNLTVLKDNPALRLYQSLGFAITGEDRYEYHMQANECHDAAQVSRQT